MWTSLLDNYTTSGASFEEHYSLVSQSKGDKQEFFVPTMVVGGTAETTQGLVCRSAWLQWMKFDPTNDVGWLSAEDGWNEWNEYNNDAEGGN